MKSSPIKIIHLNHKNDKRGNSYTVPRDWNKSIGSVKELHVLTLRPGFTHGNHFHMNKFEVIMVMYWDEWTFHWDSGVDTKVEKQSFSEEGTVMIEVKSLISHAILNGGKKEKFFNGV
jgi:hypothetical protein